MAPPRFRSSSYFGFVLPYGFFKSGRSEILTKMVLKRWLRLAFLVFIATMVSWSLFSLGLYHHREAAALTRSSWMDAFGGTDPSHTFVPTFLSALDQGTIGTFLDNRCNYDVVLWTMYHEFFGSFVSIALALFSFRASRPGVVWIMLSAAVMTQYTDPRLISFVAGTSLSYFIATSEFRISRLTSILCIALGAYLFGYNEPRGIHEIFLILNDGSPMRLDQIFINSLSGILLIVGFMGNEAIGRVLTLKAFKELGRLSFPMYLFHVPILFSLGSSLFLVIRPHVRYGVTTGAVFVAVSIAVFCASWFFAWADAAWLRVLGRATDRFFVKSPATQPPVRVH
jgi:peptidoglycan/LPS O-acetylase OafA/YrhL